MHIHAVYVFYLNMLCANHFILTQESGPSTFLSNFLSVTDVYAGYSKQPEGSFHFSCHQLIHVSGGEVCFYIISY